MPLPFSADDENLAEVRRRSIIRRKKARALAASGYQPYARLGRDIEGEEDAAEELAQRGAQRKYDEALRALTLEREQERDARETAHRAEQMSFNREREQNDVTAEARHLEEAAANRASDESFRRDQLGLQRRALAQSAETARAMQEFRNRQLAQGARPAPGALPAPGEEPVSLDERVPETALPGKPPVFQQKAVMDSAAAIMRLNRAYKRLKKTPGAYSAGNQALGAGAAIVGGIPVLGHALGPPATSAGQRLMTKEERELRNEVDSLVDEAIKAISGGQVTQYEDLRKTYLPRPYDSAPIVEDKIRGMLTKAIDTYKSYGGMENPTLPGTDAPEAGEPDVDDIVQKYLNQPKQRPGLLRSH